MSRNTIARINLAAMQHNLRVVQRLAPASKVASVVKADGYGHGIEYVATALEGADLLAVATADEARVLRHGGWTGRLLMLEGVANADDFKLAQSSQAEMVIHHGSQLQILRQQHLHGATRIWLKVDSGMHRLGFPLADTAQVYAQLEALVGQGRVILMTHFACADEPENPMTLKQVHCFDAAIDGLGAEQSLANSAAVLNFPHTHRDFIRPGLLLYGISPTGNLAASAIGLQPAMTLSSELIAINEYRMGDSIGYGASYQCPEDMRVGVVAIGYGDGYPRQLRNGAPVLVNGRVACLAGRVSMDMITLDLRGHDDAVIGDPVTLWGDGLGVETVARWADTIPYELVCGLTGRVPRVMS